MNTFDEMKPTEKIDALLGEIDGALFGLEISHHADQGYFIEYGENKAHLVTPEEERKELIGAIYDSLNELAEVTQEMKEDK